ncbi:putative Magnesium-chelatase subunit H [Hibiscus syriacus]|uniref:Magnesium-chelatase subunit H n=1 Tax=Hibiscus syriacus TaxID=106335 RepID=A0A6A2YX89_HIBSY|nr:probable glycosyltransferase STELLO2 [Hibiscus syriacus]KAE8683602.1 putative Magnesium-chelatase subunit H [Hibiscus syriacus]
MLVQDRAVPKSSKPSQIRTLPTTQPNRFSESKNLDFSIWVSENFYRIISIFVLISTVAAVFFLYSSTDTASFICLQSRTQRAMDSISLPQINWNSVKPITDKTSPYANFRSEQWIVVSVSSYPSDALQKMVKIKGWQVLAIGNSRTPRDWSLKGAIFLSLDTQASLGFRVVDHLPYDSYVRKSVGYLFAIQHGAKKIFDADDRGEVIDNDIRKHFDVELVGEGARQEVILQYKHDNPDRKIVNPYIHFGQRSVWPRGLPLENVGEIGHEEFYTEVFGGKQFIQQGISNGLPDVDSVFYFTRKSGLEAFDIRFDEHAPKVALPQGMMVPVNSFNTIYHSSAFWALMLPVSVSTMASDVLRGYWGQRLLWEIGGYVAVYPPTVHRYDRIEAYPFSDEKDLHLNVGRLIKFLVSWRSNKHRLFEKILELSYAMAEEGFWTVQDLKFTAAWLQDLLAVGYQQPRLMTLELDRPRATIGHGDRKEFIPQRLPSVHLAVEETGTVSSEIGNLIRWRKNFGNVVLIMFCNGPVERTALEWRLLYGRIFKTVVILSAKKNSDLAVEEGQLDHLYKQMPKIFNQFPSADGFLFVEDDTVLNYWNLLQADKAKLWITDKVPMSWSTTTTKENSDWYSKQADMVNKVVSTMPVHFQVNYKEVVKNEQSLIICSSEIFYVPRHFVADFVDLVNQVGQLDIHQKVAVPMFFVSMDSPGNFDSVLSTMVYKQDLPSTNSSSTHYSAQAPAVHPWKVSSEEEFIKLIRIMAEGDPFLMELV